MRPDEIIEKITCFVEDDEDCNGAFLLGSHARGDYGPGSDIDVFIVSSDNDSIGGIFERIDGYFGLSAVHRINFSSTKQILFIGRKFVRVDLTIVSDIEEMKTFYLHSLISDPDKSILVDKRSVLRTTFKKWGNERFPEDIGYLVSMEVEKFLDSFETASRYACMGDAFRFYFNFNLCLTRYIRLVNLEEGKTAFLYTPRNFLEGKSLVNRRNVERMAGALHLSEARPLLEKLATEFRGIYAKLRLQYPGLSRSNDNIGGFIRDVMYRDLIWNLRDVSWVDQSVIGSGKLYRASAISRFEEQRGYTRLLDELGIKRIIDLRAEHEVAKYPYSETTFRKVEVVNLFMGPVAEHERIFDHSGKMHVDMLDNSRVIRQFFSLLSDGVPTLVHCYSGKDRTGVLIALVLLILGVSVEDVKKDFLASGMDLTEGHAMDLFGILQDRESAMNILCQLNISEKDIEMVKAWLAG